MVQGGIRKVCTAVAALVAGVGSEAFAEVLISNFAAPFRGATPIGNNPNPVAPEGGGPWYWATQSFMTDGSLHQLDSIEAIVGDGSDAPAPVVVAELRENNAGEIGALITTLTAPEMSGGLAARTFTPDAPVTLAAGTVYWVLLGVQVPGDGTFTFAYVNGDDAIGPGSIGEWADSMDSGANWNYQIDFPYFLQVNATPVVDSDGDGVDDPADACCHTPPGVLVDAAGRPVGDLDGDCDNDLADYALYTQGFTGPLVAPAECCASGQIFCADVCIDPQTDDGNCGGCGIVCGAELTCQDGLCAP